MKTSLYSNSSWKHQGVALLGIAAMLTLCGQSSVYAQLSASDIAAMKQEIAKQKFTFTVDENPATKIPLSELCGTIPSLAPKSANTLSSKTMVAETALPSYWDWRQHNGVTPVKDQGNCGSCWAFSTVGTMEAMILIASGTTTDLSEQQLVSCNPYGWGCGGGNYAFDMEISPGAMLESCFPYQAADVACQSGCPHVFQLSSWGYVGDSGSVPSTTAIKNAIYTYGPISVCVAVDSYFQAYSGGVFNDNSASAIDHAVVLVGWDDSNGCWIMKNSWGTGWGESGYMRIAYGCDQIGYAAAYAVCVSPEPLLITPVTGFTSSGGVGGPFTITSQSLTLTNAGTNTLTWSLVNTSLWLNVSPGGGTLTPGGPSATVTASLNSVASNLVVGTYSATVWFTNLSDSVGIGRTFALNILGPPVITSQPTNQTVSPGNTATFTVGVTGLAPLSYQWWFNNSSNIPNATNLTLTLVGVTASQAGNYNVVVTNSLGSATSQVATLTINPNLVQNGGFEAGNFTSWGGSMLGAFVSTGTSYVHSGTYGAALGPVGSLGYLSQTLITTTGSNYLVSLWLDNLGATPNEFQVTWNGNTIFDGLNMAPFGWTNLQFVVAATSASSTLQFGFRQDPSYLGLDDISVTPTNLGPSAAAIVTQPANQTAPVGGSATFSVTATGTAPLNYFWMRNGALISGANGTSYSTNNVQLFDSGSQFSCLVSNAYGTALSSNAVLTVFPVIVGLITFDDLLTTSGGTPVPVGYHNLSWSNFYYMNGVTYVGPSGYNAGVVSVSNVAYNAYGSPASISNSTPFNLVSAYLTAAWYDNLQVEARGYIGTTLVYDNVYILSATSPTLINFGYAGITEVVFISSGGTAHPGYSGSGTHFVVDNMLIQFPALNPTLQMALSGNLLLFFWPASNQGFVLETSPRLFPATWVPVSNQPIQIGDQYVVPAALSGSMGFYRLYHP